MKRRDLLKLLAGTIVSGTTLGRLEANELGKLSGEEREELEELIDEVEESSESSESSPSPTSVASGGVEPYCSHKDKPCRHRFSGIVLGKFEHLPYCYRPNFTYCTYYEEKK